MTAAARNVVVGEAVDEYRRLLYVALTRAADRLIICGSVGVRRRPDGCWYDLDLRCADAALRRGAGGRRRRHGAALSQESRERPRRCRLILLRNRRRLATFRTGCAAMRRVEEPPPAPLSPSQAYDEPAPRPRIESAARKAALERGLAMHRLLQSLPAIVPERRAEAARRYLARKKELTVEDRDDLARKALLVTEDRRFHGAVPSGSKAEVPIVGRVVHGGGVAAGGWHHRPPGGHRGRDPHRRLQDQPRSAAKARRRAERPMWRSSRSIARCSRSSTLVRPSAPP